MSTKNDVSHTKSEVTNGNQNDKKFKNEHFDYQEIEKMLPEELDNLYSTMPLTKETTCGFWIFKGWFLQK